MVFCEDTNHGGGAEKESGGGSRKYRRRVRRTLGSGFGIPFRKSRTAEVTLNDIKNNFDVKIDGFVNERVSKKKGVKMTLNGSGIFWCHLG
jgi:hypothetical protein